MGIPFLSLENKRQCEIKMKVSLIFREVFGFAVKQNTIRGSGAQLLFNLTKPAGVTEVEILVPKPPASITVFIFTSENKFFDTTAQNISIIFLV